MNKNFLAEPIHSSFDWATSITLTRNIFHVIEPEKNELCGLAKFVRSVKINSIYFFRFLAVESPAHVSNGVTGQTKLRIYTIGTRIRVYRYDRVFFSNTT